MIIMVLRFQKLNGKLNEMQKFSRCSFERIVSHSRLGEVQQHVWSQSFRQPQQNTHTHSHDSGCSCCVSRLRLTCEHAEGILFYFFFWSEEKKLWNSLPGTFMFSAGEPYGDSCPHCQRLPKAGVMTMMLLCSTRYHQTWTPHRAYAVLSKVRWKHVTIGAMWASASVEPEIDHLHDTSHWCSDSCKQYSTQR